MRLLAALILAASMVSPSITPGASRPGATAIPALPTVPGMEREPSRQAGAPAPSPAASDVPDPRPSDGTSPKQPAPALITGPATWYCLPGRSACSSGFPASGMYAAAGPALRRAIGPRWRSARVTVTRTWTDARGGEHSATVVVRLADWCACPGVRVLDLYGSAFSRLAPLSRGVLRVEVSW